ncbi:hypothetical protein [Photobacterium damselae]
MPAQQAVWLIILMRLIRNQSIKEVCGVLRRVNCWRLA